MGNQALTRKRKSSTPEELHRNENVLPSDIAGQSTASNLSITGTLIKTIKTFYNFKKELGKGHFGSVYLCNNLQHGYPAALKVLRKRCLNRKTIATLKSEIELLMKVAGHPNIVQLYECLEDNSNLYLAMECCTGGELFDAIVNSPAYKFEDERHVAAVVADVLCAVEYCHGIGVCHRDLKPENLMLSTPPDPGVNEYPSIKVIDFGLSRCYEEGEYMHKAVGTPYYIAPEVLQRSYGKECDMWSLGVILYVLLCGYPPFYAEEDNEIHRMIMSGKSHTFPSKDWDQVSDVAKDLINRCLVHDPTARINAKDALQHPFVTALAGPASKVYPLAGNFANNLKLFKHGNRFQKVVKMKIAESMTVAEIEGLHKTFKDLDKDGNNILSVKEIKAAVESQLHAAGSKASIMAKEIVQSLDIAGDGVIHYEEFIAGAMTKKQWATIDHLHYAFEAFDVTNSGTLTKPEIMLALGGGDVHLANEILDKFDEDHDGGINYDEFVKVMLNNS